jgi:uncharacterized protein (TIGR02453 family)
MLSKSSLLFFTELKHNNHREWFLNHKKEYEFAKKEFAFFISELIASYGLKDPSIAHLEPKDCLFRINRDVRFSKDKSPYKTNMGASINTGGKKGVMAGYYFHLEPGASFVGGGLYMPDSPTLAKLRQEIDYNWQEFEAILENKAFKTIFKDLDKSDDIKLQRIPKGYEMENPAAEYLKLKSFVAISKLTDVELLDKNLLKQTVEAFTALQPLILFINRCFD